SSGSSLHRRGYRTDTNIAPLNEVLAAGILLLGGWRGQSDFLDPMCGSGTLLIEAAMIACNIPANINREGFGFQTWKDYDAELFKTIYEASLGRTRDFPYKITGYDKAPSAVRKAQENIRGAKLSDFIQVENQDFFKSRKRSEAPLFLIANPPYGERLPVETERFYKQWGDTLKQQYAGTKAWLFTGNLEGLKFVGLRPSRKIKLFNGSIESRLVRYDIYEGSKKAKKQQ
ncbi:MAG: class I SAM-dependent RNA methyltransferase, partial [Robiginitalea sp.]|nr:class I SAM-dependent RNA methyltransferase [Robiginitalea sp.]